jgi:anti-sigma B factor antagonist
VRDRLLTRRVLFQKRYYFAPGFWGMCRVLGFAATPFPNQRRFKIMSINFSDVGENLRKIVITGRLDLSGADSVAAKLEALAAEPKKAVVVDLSSLRFLASIGIRSLITSAKAVQQRGGKMVLVVGDNSSVAMSLESTGVEMLIPTFKNAAEAERAAVA